MSSSLLFQTCPTCLVHLIWIILEMGDLWEYSWSFLGCCFSVCSFRQDFSLCAYTASTLYIYIFELTQLLLGRNSVLFCRINRTFIWLITHQDIYIYIYIYIYIHCHPQTDCFLVSQLFCLARHVGRLKLGLKPTQLYVRLSIIPLRQQAYHFSSGIIR